MSRSQTSQNNTLTSGVLWKQILSFALPIAATSMLQQLFNSTDSAVVGRFAGSNALAAVGCTSSIVNLAITLLTGLSLGANVTIAHAIGAGDKDTSKKSVDTAMLIAVISGVAAVILFQIIAKPLLTFMGTPDDIFEGALSYLRIFFIGLFFLMIYNFEAAILRASGDSKKPLYCLFFTGFLNLVLNIIFVVFLKMGVVGVALGTLIADIANALLLLYFLIKGNGIVQFSFKNFEPELSDASEIFRIGLPAAAQGMMFNIANVIIQTGFNRLGSDVIAASTIALNTEIFSYYLISGFTQAAVTFNGQNLGAGDLKRCKESTVTSLLLGEAFIIALIVAFNLVAEPFVMLFSTDPAVIALAVRRIRIVLVFEIFNLIFEVVAGALRGMGHSTLPAVVTAIFICGTRILWVLFLFPIYHTMEALIFVYPVSWSLGAIVLIICYIVTFRKTAKNPEFA